MAASFISVNIAHSDPPEVDAADGSGRDFTLSAPPKSDIYVSPHPPNPLYDYTAPIVCKRIAKEAFISLQVTAAAAWRTQFDQAGLVFTLPTKSNPNPSASTTASASMHPSWVKAGIECNNGAPCISVVARSPGGWADWSLIPLSLVGESLGTIVPVTLKFTRDKNALMVWLIRSVDAGKAPQKLLIRKVPWVFLDDPTGPLGSDVLVGVYAAQPDPYDVSEGKALEVAFSGLKVEAKESEQ